MMGGNFLFALLPALGFLIWLGIVIYLLMLATRLVDAVETIAERLGRAG